MVLLSVISVRYKIDLKIRLNKDAEDDSTQVVDFAKLENKLTVSELVFLFEFRFPEIKSESIRFAVSDPRNDDSLTTIIDSLKIQNHNLCQEIVRYYVSHLQETNKSVFLRIVSESKTLSDVSERILREKDFMKEHIVPICKMFLTK